MYATPTHLLILFIYLFIHFYYTVSSIGQVIMTAELVTKQTAFSCVPAGKKQKKIIGNQTTQ